MRCLAVVTVLLSLATGAGIGSQAGAPAITDSGPPIGERVPDFSLIDQAGATRTLASILGPNGAMLVFFRSAEW
jgi:hypothetical protein